MPTFAEVTANGLHLAPQVPGNAVRWLWIRDFWDGPLSGMVEFAGEHCWSQMMAENEDEDLRGWYRRLVIVRLTPEQLVEERRWEELFCENVGWHWNYVKDAPGRYEGLRPREQWDAFYRLYEQRIPLDLSHNEVLAWFEQ